MSAQASTGDPAGNELYDQLAHGEVTPLRIRCSLYAISRVVEPLVVSTFPKLLELRDW